MSNNTSNLHWWSYVPLILVGMIAFWPSVWFDFVNWDDPAYVANNELIKSWSPANLYGVATETVTRNYAPLTILSLLIDHSIWGMNPCGYHASNVLLHLLNGVLVLILVRQLSGSHFVAWITAALFLVHPVQIETVAWISSRKGLLSATFMLAALIIRLKPAVEAKHDGWYVVWLAAALLSKALAVVVPAIVLGYDVWVRRQKFADAFARQIIPGVMCLLLLLKTMASQNSILGGVRGHMDLGLLQILAVDSTILWRYIGMLFWPSELCVLYDPPVTGIGTSVALATAGWFAVSVVVWRNCKHHPTILWSAVTFLLLLLPVLNFFKITTLMNDRYLYLPCICVFAVMAAGFNRALMVLQNHTNEFWARVATGMKWTAGMTAIGCAMISTSGQLPVWKNANALWTDAMAKAPQLPVVRIQMALTKHDSGQKREAVMTLQRSLFECEPDSVDRKRIVNMIRSWIADFNVSTTEQTTLIIR